MREIRNTEFETVKSSLHESGKFSMQLVASFRGPFRLASQRNIGDSRTAELFQSLKNLSEYLYFCFVWRQET